MHFACAVAEPSRSSRKIALRSQLNIVITEKSCEYCGTRVAPSKALLVSSMNKDQLLKKLLMLTAVGVYVQAYTGIRSIPGRCECIAEVGMFLLLQNNFSDGD